MVWKLCSLRIAPHHLQSTKHKEFSSLPNSGAFLLLENSFCFLGIWDSVDLFHSLSQTQSSQCGNEGKISLCSLPADSFGAQISREVAGTAVLRGWLSFLPDSTNLRAKIHGTAASRRCRCWLLISPPVRKVIFSRDATARPRNVRTWAQSLPTQPGSGTTKPFPEERSKELPPEQRKQALQ